MANEKRVLDPNNIRQIVERLSTERKEFLTRFEKVMIDTRNFAMTASNAIGEISYGEAVQGVIDYFIFEIRKVK